MPEQKTNADSLRLYNSGASSDGSAQADPNLSLGNRRSSTEISWLSAVITTPIAGITVQFISGKNGTGEGTLTASGTSELKWTAPGGTLGAGVTIANGETKILEDGADPSKYIRVQRTSATDLTGTATLTLSEVANNALGYDNILSAEAATGDTEYRMIAIKNENASAIGAVKFWINPLGTQRVSGTAQLSSSGSGTITTATASGFADWPASGYCHIKTSGGATREIVYYSSRTGESLTVPAAGRGLLDTTAAAGAATDTITPVSGILIAPQAPSSQPSGSWQTLANENTAPTGLTWTNGFTNTTGIDIGTLATTNIYGIWIRRQVPAGMAAAASIRNALAWSFDA